MLSLTLSNLGMKYCSKSFYGHLPIIPKKLETFPPNKVEKVLQHLSINVFIVNKICIGRLAVAVLLWKNVLTCNMKDTGIISRH